MKVAIVGSRSFYDSDVLYSSLDELRKKLHIAEIISGGAVGADTLGIMYAKDNGIPSRVFLPDWERGRQAGFERNSLIVEESDVVVAFWDGKSKGTADTIRKAEFHGKNVIIVRFDDK
jgi:hypothetical protein